MNDCIMGPRTSTVKSTSAATGISHAMVFGMISMVSLFEPPTHLVGTIVVFNLTEYFYCHIIKHHTTLYFKDFFIKWFRLTLTVIGTVNGSSNHRSLLALLESVDCKVLSRPSNEVRY